jgi:hypothetical protein
MELVTGNAGLLAPFGKMVIQLFGLSHGLLQVLVMFSMVVVNALPRYKLVDRCAEVA